MRRFEASHAMREASIVKASREREMIQSHVDYVNKVHDKLAVHQRQRTEKHTVVKRVAAERKAARTQREEAGNAERTFLARQRVIDRACREVDRLKRRSEEREIAHRAVSALRDDALAAKHELQQRRILTMAKLKAVDADERARLRYLVRKREDLEEMRIEELRDQQFAERALRHFMAEAKKELEEQESAADPNDLASYERALEAFGELAQGVREHTTKVRDVIEGRATTASTEAGTERSRDSPLMPLEPQVRAALAASGFDPDEVNNMTRAEMEASQEVEDLFASLTLERYPDSPDSPDSPANDSLDVTPLVDRGALPRLPNFPQVAPLAAAVTPGTFTPAALHTIRPYTAPDSMRTPHSSPPAATVQGRARRAGLDRLGMATTPRGVAANSDAPRRVLAVATPDAPVDIQGLGSVGESAPAANPATPLTGRCEQDSVTSLSALRRIRQTGPLVK